jgi:hypothetical protein
MGSETPPWLHQARPTMALGHVLAISEATRGLAAVVGFLPVLLLRVGGSLMNGWMWQSAEAEEIYRGARRSKGARTGLRTGQIGPGTFWPGSAPSRSPMLLGQLLTCSLCMWALDVVFSMV